ncbi:ankyrin repeat domain-containing protein [Hymenobacter sp. BT175]|uniref:ankyrin repeat domain-containing protein n=1 Tax=Hymenobacter translucens TaxID=2886507 RepID=UPI001D0E9B4A|nr:ankyrin repeat domain-containing protein [Hymenobacter translucens]MCC2545538.1 ankyrin repeat domain-containing protein [Hymenobacter translucens]
MRSRLFIPLLLAWGLSTGALAQTGRAEFKQAELAYEAGKYKEALFYLGEAERALGGSNARIESLKTLSYYDQGNTVAALLALTQYFKLATASTRASEEYKAMEVLREEIKALNEAGFAAEKKAIGTAQARELAALDQESAAETETYYYNLVKGAPSPKAIREFLRDYPQSARKSELEEKARRLDYEQDKMKSPEKYLFGAIEQRNQAMFEELLGFGVKLDGRNSAGQQPLHAAIERDNLSMVQQLLSYGADQEAKDQAGNTPLLLALQKNNEEMVAELLQHGASVAVRNSALNGPVFFAIANNSVTQLQQLLLLKADVRSANQAGASPLLSAVARPKVDVKIIYTLLNAGAEPDQVLAGYTALYHAVQDGKNDIAQILLKAGADANVKLPSGGTLLFLATTSGNPALVDMLLDAKAEPNTADASGWAPLHYAAWKGNAAIVESLVAHRAEVNVKGPHGWTPLHYAVRENNAPMVELLLAKKASRKATDSWKRTPLKIAREYHFKALKRKLS